MYTDLSTGYDYPKTLIIRNQPGRMIWQIYHVDNKDQVIYLANNATQTGFLGITLENYQPDEQETSPNWRMDTAEYFIRLLPTHLTFKEGVQDVLEEDDDY